MPQIKQVYDSLNIIASTLGELRTLALQERQDIIDLNLAGLSGRRGEIEKLLSRVDVLNRQVIQQISDACDSLGLAKESSLSLLITAVPKPDRDMYAELQKRVRSGSAAAENELAVNNALLKDSLAFTNYSLQMFTGALKSSRSSTYGQQGRFVESIDQPRIICKEI